MKTFIWFVLLAASLSARAQRTWVTPDLFIETTTDRGDVTGTPENCRQAIVKAMCFVEAPFVMGQETEKRPCLEGGKEYAKHFEALYDAYPPALQKVFCSVRKIFIEKEFFGTAYAGILKNPEGKPLGAQIGIRKSVLDENLNLRTWASWKEQLSFGGVEPSYAITSDLPIISTRSHSPVNDFLYFVIAHEFGHIFDLANGLNRFKSPECGVKEPSLGCEMHEESWGALSWATSRTPLPQNEFAHRPGLCFYWCKGKPLPKAAIFPLYHGLYATDFISTYATTQPWDDFADSLAYYLMAKNLHTRYFIDTRHGRSYDITRKLYSKRFSRKYRYLEEFLNRSDIIYP